jgi:hypothetical protein
MDRAQDIHRHDPEPEDTNVAAGAGKVAFRDFLDKNPEARASIQQRLESIPEYRQWLQMFGKGVLAALEPQQGPAGGTR